MSRIHIVWFGAGPAFHFVPHEGSARPDIWATSPPDVVHFCPTPIVGIMSTLYGVGSQHGHFVQPRLLHPGPRSPDGLLSPPRHPPPASSASSRAASAVASIATCMQHLWYLCVRTRNLADAIVLRPISRAPAGDGRIVVTHSLDDRRRRRRRRTNADAQRRPTTTSDDHQRPTTHDQGPAAHDPHPRTTGRRPRTPKDRQTTPKTPPMYGTAFCDPAPQAPRSQPPRCLWWTTATASRRTASPSLASSPAAASASAAPRRPRRAPSCDTSPRCGRRLCRCRCARAQCTRPSWRSRSGRRRPRRPRRLSSAALCRRWCADRRRLTTRDDRRPTATDDHVLRDDPREPTSMDHRRPRATDDGRRSMATDDTRRTTTDHRPPIDDRRSATTDERWPKIHPRWESCG